MPEILGSDKPILGMPRKVAIPVLGVALVAVVYVVIRSRSQGGAIPRAQPEQGGNTGAIGGGGGGSVGGVYDAAPVNPIQQRLDQLYLERENFAYNVQQRQEDERQANYEIQHQEQQSTLDAFLSVLPNQIETQKSREAANQAGYQADVARAGYAEEAFNTARAGEEVVQRSIAGKSKVECPVGMHFVVNAEGGGQCQPLGGGGFSFKTLFSGIGNIAEGLLSGAASAAPGIGAGAAQVAARQAGLIPGIRRPSASTPPINPRTNGGTDASFEALHSPFSFTGSTSPQYPGIG